MSSSAPGPRPRQVTIGGWLIAVTSAVLVVSAFDAMAQLHSLDTRDRLTKALTGWPSDLGISVGDAISLVHAALFVTAVAAVVTGILGVFVLQRDSTARLVLTVAAVPVVITAPVASGFLGLLIGGATVMLWTPEARDWFAGRAPSRPSREPRQPAPAPFRTTDQPVSSVSPVPPPVQDSGHTPADRAGWAPPAYPRPPVPSRVPRSVAPPTVPRQVRIACVLAWVFSALTGGAYLVAILVIAVDRSRALELLRDNATVQNTSLSDRELIGLVIAVSAVVIAWSILAAVFAALTWRRQPVARALLLVSAAGAFLTEMVGLPYTLAHVAASAATFVLLLSPAARTWFAQDRSPGLPPSPGAWPAPDPRASDQQPTASTEERPAGKPPVW